MTLSKSEIIYPTERHIAWRKFFTRIYQPPIARAQVEIVDDAIRNAEDLLAKGWGLILPFTHFCARDIFEMTLRPFTASPVLIGRPAMVSVEWSHMRGLSGPRFFADLTGISTVPIVTEDTLKKRKNYDALRQPLRLGHGTFEYLNLARRVLKAGGLVFVSPQQGRRSTLELSEKEPIKFLLGKENILPNVAILFVALSLKDEADYSDKTFLNLGRTFDVKLGPLITKAEMFTLSHELNRTLDDVAIIVFSQLVDPGYNHVDPELTQRYLLVRSRQRDEPAGDWIPDIKEKSV